MALIIPDEVVDTTRMTPEELMLEVAIMLYQREKLSLAQTSKAAGMNRQKFQFLLASRQIPIHYAVADFQADLKALRDMEQP